MNPRTRIMMLKDSCVAACINMAIGGTITWLMFGRLHEVPVWGRSGLVLDAIPSTFLPVLGLCFGISSAMRQRRKSGQLSGIDADLDAAAWVRPAWLRFIPGSVPLRALWLAALTTAMVLLFTALGFRLFDVVSLMLPTVFALKLGELAIIGLLLGPIVVYRTLLDR